MKIKDGVVMTGLQLPMRLALIAADQIWRDYKYELTITEGTGGEHSAGSLHYYGYAVDIRASEDWGFTQGDVGHMVEKLKKSLGSDYNVIVHKSHVHCEYDKAKYL